MPIKTSYFNSEKTYNPTTQYAVTLLRGENNNHAQIFVEGEDNEGQSFVKQAHFVGPKSFANNSGNDSYFTHGKRGHVKDFRDTNLERVRFGSAATWVVDKADVEKMMVVVHEEYELQTNQKKYIPFNILGRYSIFNSKSWQISKNTVFGTIAGLIVAMLLVPTGIPELALGFAALGLLFGGAATAGVATAVLHEEPHSCITWAKEKLSKAGVYVELSPLQYLFSYTTTAINLAQSQKQLSEEDFVEIKGDRENIRQFGI